MAYATKQDMLDRVGEADLIALTDRARLGVIDDTILARALNDVETMINGYLAGRYQLPLTIVVASLTRAECDMAIYQLSLRPTENQKTRYDDAIAWLKDLSTGKAMLGADSPNPNPPVPDGIQVTTNARVFTSDNLKDY